MGLEVATIGITLLIFLAALIRLRSSYQASTVGWRLLAWSGITLSLGGLGFIVRFWKPTEGPYLANEIYPYGAHLNAWAVSFGFTWLAFGLLFFGLATLGVRDAMLTVWVTLLASWALCWLPHGVIGVAYAWAGRNEPSIETYRVWGSNLRGFLVLLEGSVILVAHFSLSLLGFLLTGRELLGRRSRP
ncbi:MAG TPA: hypothetical protein VGK94_15490 [Candidatus Polarisedimenticolia bacterium]|jgi:hypothetical protein